MRNFDRLTPHLFAPPEQEQPVTDTKKEATFLPLMMLGATLVILALAATAGGDHDQTNYGTDRAAEEDESERRTRERAGGRAYPDETSRTWRNMSDQELLQYYRQHYNGISRGKLAAVDSSFYQTLRTRGLLDDIEVSNRAWETMSDDELRAYYQQHYSGVSRGKLASVDPSFYNTLRKRGLIDEIPTRRELEEARYRD